MSRPALRADFRRYYGLDFRECLAGSMKPSEVADLAVELPRGAQIWVHAGGPAAVTAETEMLIAVEYGLALLGYQNGGNKGAEPQPRPYPKSAAEIARDNARTLGRAERWRQRHMNN